MKIVYKSSLQDINCFRFRWIFWTWEGITWEGERNEEHEKENQRLVNTLSLQDIIYTSLWIHNHTIITKAFHFLSVKHFQRDHNNTIYMYKPISRSVIQENKTTRRKQDHRSEPMAHGPALLVGMVRQWQVLRVLVYNFFHQFSSWHER